MTLEKYQFTAFNPLRGEKYQFVGYLLPNGEVMVPEFYAVDSFYRNLGHVCANDGIILSWASAERWIEFSQQNLREALRNSALEYGVGSIPHSLLMYYEN